MNIFQRKKVVLSLLVAILGVFLLVRYQLNRSDRPIVVRIGNLMPFNSDLMNVATKMKNGMELAKEDLLTKHPGLKIEMDYQNGCFEREAAPAVQKFVQAGVSIIGGSFCLFGHIPILPLTEANRIITFNTAANPDVVLNKKFAFSTNVEIKDEAEKMADFAYKKVGGRRAITMHLDTPFGHDYNKYFGRQFQKLGGQLLFNIPNAPDGKDFKQAISKIKAANPNVIVTAHFGVPLGTFYKEVRAAGIKAPIVGNYETEDEDVVNAAEGAAEGVIFSSSELITKTNTMEQFEQRYVRKYGVAPDVIVTNSYDDIVLGVEAFLKCNGDRECMATEMHKIKDYQGVSGVITINASGATYKPTIFKTIKDRTFIPYE